MNIRLIGLDADDTLWHNETIFRAMQDRFLDLLVPYGNPDDVQALLDVVERRNFNLYGYGAKGFTLSMVEAALEISRDGIATRVVSEILAMGRTMMAHPIEPLPGVEDAVAVLAGQGRPLVLITKGDLMHQEAKLAASGLGASFSGVEIVSEKTPDTYRRIFSRYGVAPEDVVMAGNSVRSDILPVLDTGGYAALIPYPLVWSHEAASAPHGHPRFRECASLAELPQWIAEIDRAQT